MKRISSAPSSHACSMMFSEVIRVYRQDDIHAVDLYNGGVCRHFHLRFLWLCCRVLTGASRLFVSCEIRNSVDTIASYYVRPKANVQAMQNEGLQRHLQRQWEYNDAHKASPYRAPIEL